MTVPMPNDPIAELLSKWRRESSECARNKEFAQAHVFDAMATALYNAMQTRPRGSAEQVGEIYRLKDHVLKLRLATVKFRSAYALSELRHELLDDADKTAAKYYEETK